mgnify:FL=1
MEYDALHVLQRPDVVGLAGAVGSCWGGVGRLNIWLKGLCHAALPGGLLPGCKYN